MKLRVEAAEGVDDECHVGDRHAHVAQRVGEFLEAATVLGDGEIALVQAMELLLGIDGALHRDVEEEIANCAPDAIRRRLRHHDHPAEILGDGGVKPSDHARVDL